MARKSNRPKQFLDVILILTLAASARAIAEPLFENAAPLTFRLEAPFSDIARERKDPQYRPAKLTIAGDDGVAGALDLKVRARGKSRVQACDFPPLLLNFPKQALHGTPFEGEDRLKLVTHCNSNSAFEQYVLLERQLYRVMNLLTDASLRVRPVVVTYYDSSRSREIATKPGFLIENEQRFADRMGFKTVSAERVDYARYDLAALALVDVFEYFIGNTDWSAAAGPAGEPCCHNVVPFERPDGKLVPVPYDFDATGLVNVPYALPDERLPIKTVRTRLYRGRCHDAALLKSVLDRFVERRPAIEALFQGPDLTEKASNGARAYIAEFYALIADPRKSERAFNGACPR